MATMPRHREPAEATGFLATARRQRLISPQHSPTGILMGPWRLWPVWPAPFPDDPPWVGGQSSVV